MGTYVVGDIHGCFDEWMKLKNRIEKQDPEAKFILIGDIIDRGPKVIEMVRWAMKNITPDGKYQMILGNHENMIIDWYRKGQVYGDTSYHNIMQDHYNFKGELEKHNVTDEELVKIISFFKSLPLTKDLYINTGNARGKQHYIIVHAFIYKNMLNKDESVSKNALKFKKDNLVGNYEIKRNREQVLWERNYADCTWLDHSIIVHGHTPTLETKYCDVMPGKAYFRYCNINVDCGIVYAGHKDNNLCALRLEDLQEFYLYNKKVHMNKKQLNFRQEMKNFIKGKRRKKEKYIPYSPEQIAELEKLLGIDI